jgi:hypothetical protein
MTSISIKSKNTVTKTAITGSHFSANGFIIAVLFEKNKTFIMKYDATNYLMTKFFYRNNHLCFQILLVSNSTNETPSNGRNEKHVTLGEFTNYADYRKDFFSFQQKLEQNLPITPIVTKMLEKQNFATSLVA